MIHVRLQQFEGPLDLLLQLIEQNRLDITTVSLAEVTEQYLGTLELVERTQPDELADFLVVAAKLLLIKSRVLLPQLDAFEDDGISLEDQLKLYQTFVAAAATVKKLYRRNYVLWPRIHAETVQPIFSPPERLAMSELRRVFLDVLHSLEPLMVIPETTIARTISLQQKISAIRDFIVAHTTVNFRELLERAESRMDVIVTFLALLELVKQRTAFVVQDENFSEIQIERVTETVQTPQ